MSVGYPVLEGAAPGVADVNRQIERALRSIVDEWKPTATPDPDWEGASCDVCAYVSGGFFADLLTDEAFSTLVSLHAYTGGAHGNSYHYAYTFDLTTGRPVQARSLFRPGSGWEREVARLAVDDIRRQGFRHDDRASMMRSRAVGRILAGDPLFTIGPDSLYIHFPTYALASFADGDLRAAIPASALRSSLRPEGLLGESRARPVDTSTLTVLADLDRRRAAVEAGDLTAQLGLGNAYWNGEGIGQNQVEGLRYYRMAADQGHAAAQSHVGVVYLFSDVVPKNARLAAHYFRLAAAQGDAVAQSNLGALYERGEGVKRDDVEAVRLYRLAAAQGYANAQSNLGHMYVVGQGIAADTAAAVRYFRLSASQGNPSGETSLGYHLEKGTGAPRDLDAAIQLYRRAAAQGYALGQTNLGRVHEKGIGVAADLAEAVRLYRLAVAQNEPYAAAYLGALYETGRGVPRDLTEARRLFQQAAYADNELGREGLARLDGGGLPSEVPRAQTRRLPQAIDEVVAAHVRENPQYRFPDIEDFDPLNLAYYREERGIADFDPYVSSGYLNADPDEDYAVLLAGPSYTEPSGNRHNSIRILLIEGVPYDEPTVAYFFDESLPADQMSVARLRDGYSGIVNHGLTFWMTESDLYGRVESTSAGYLSNPDDGYDTLDEEQPVLVRADSLRLRDPVYDFTTFVGVPVLEGESAAARTVNRRLAREIRALVEAFKPTDPHDPQDPSCGFCAHVVGWFDVDLARQGIFSTLVTLHAYTGGAHGLSYLHPYTFDLRTGQPVAARDLFRAGSGWEQALVRLAREGLTTLRRERGVRDFRDHLSGRSAVFGRIASGTPLFTLGPDVFIVHFPHYTAGSFAEGTYHVPIPREALARYLRSDIPPGW